MTNSSSDTHTSFEQVSSQDSPPPLTFSESTLGPSSELPRDMNERVTSVQDPPNDTTTARCNSTSEGPTYADGQPMNSSPPTRPVTTRSEQVSNTPVNWDQPGPDSPIQRDDGGALRSEVQDELMQGAVQQEDEDASEEEESGS
jgi:hypothetical protein